MKVGEILYNLNNLKIGETIKIYSSSEDVFNNEKIEIYNLERKEDGFYVSYAKKTSFEETDIIEFNKKAIEIGADREEKKMIEQMGLNEIETILLNEKAIEENIIRKGHALKGKYEDLIEFAFPNIIHVCKKGVLSGAGD